MPAANVSVVPGVGVTRNEGAVWVMVLPCFPVTTSVWPIVSVSVTTVSIALPLRYVVNLVRTVAVTTMLLQKAPISLCAKEVVIAYAERRQPVHASGGTGTISGIADPLKGIGVNSSGLAGSVHGVEFVEGTNSWGNVGSVGSTEDIESAEDVDAVVDAEAVDAEAVDAIEAADPIEAVDTLEAVGAGEADWRGTELWDEGLVLDVPVLPGGEAGNGEAAGDGDDDDGTFDDLCVSSLVGDGCAGSVHELGSCAGIAPGETIVEERFPSVEHVR